jgi:type I restriction enzyme S subunit
MTALSGIGALDLPAGWRAMRLGSMLEQRRETVAVQEDVEYRLLGVRWYGEGAFHRETVTRDTTEAVRLQPVRAGDLIYNRLFAWKGSFGLVPPALGGAYVSGEFPLFSARPGHDIRFVAYYFLQPWVWELISAESTGATAVSRNRWKEESLRAFVVPAPPLDEQIAIADFLDTHTQEIRELLFEFGAALPPAEGSLAALLSERRSALITAAVTGGLPVERRKVA